MEARSQEELIKEIAALTQQIEQLKKNSGHATAAENNFLLSIEQAADAILISDREGDYVFVNDNACRLLGYSREELLTLNLRSLVPADDLERNPLRISEINQGHVVFMERQLLKKDGSRVDVEVSASLMKDGCIQATVRNISERKKLQKQLEESEQRFRILSESAFEALAVHENGILMEVNKAFCALFGYSNEHELIGRSVLEFASEESVETIKKNIAENYQGQYEAVGVKADGSRIFCILISKLIPYHNRTARVTAIRDITQEKNFEHALKKSEEQYRLLFYKNPLPMWVYSRTDHRILAVNEAAVSHYGYSEKEFCSMTLFDIRPEGEKKRLAEHHEKGRAANSHGLWKHRKKNGEIIDVEVTTGTLQTEDANTSLAVINDVTEKLRVTNALQESEFRFRMLAENALDIVYRYAFYPIPHYEYVSPSVEIITGYTPEDFYSNPYLGFTIIHPDDRAIAGNSEELIREGKDIAHVRSTRMIARWITRDGRTIWTETHNKPIFDSERKVVAVEGISRDITERQRVEKELVESEEKFRLLSSSAPIGIFLADFKGNPYYVNKKFEEITGLPYGRIVNNSWQRLIHPEDAGRVVEGINNTVAAGKDFSDEFRVRNYLKGLRWVKFQVTSFRSEENGRKGWVGTIEDVTERYETENRYRQLFENNTAGVFRTSVGGEVLECNDAFVKILGYPSREAIRKANAKTFYFSEQDRKDYIRDLKNYRTLNNYHLRVRTPEGEERFILANVTFHESAESGSYIEGTLIDITQSIRAEQALKENERVLSTLMSNLPGMAYRCLNDDKWTMKFVSKGCVQLTGHKPEDLLNNSKRTFSSIVHPDDRHVGREQIDQAIRTRTPFEIEYRIITADKKTKWVWEKGEGVFDDEGHLIFLEGFITDVTDRKQYEAEIKLGRENYKNLIDNSPIGVLIHDEDGQILFINPTAMQIMGISSLEEFNGFHMFHFVLQEYQDALREQKRRLQRGENNLPFVITKIRRPDGKVIDVESKASPIVYMGRPAIQVVCQDITYQRQLETERLRAEIAEESNKKLQQEINERKNAERILSETQKYTRMLIDSSLDMICASDKQGFVTEFNAAAQRTFGYTLEEVLGKHVSMLYANPKERIRITEKFLYKSGTFAGEVVNRRKNGDLFTAFLSASVLKNKDGEIVGAMGVSRDITEIKMAEEQIRISEERYRAIYSQAYIGIAQVSPKGEILQANEQYCKILGFPLREMLHKTINDLTHPDDREVTRQLRNSVIKGKTDHLTLEKKYIHRNGSVIYASLTVSSVRDSKGKHEYSIVVIQDITEKKKADEQMRIQAAKMNAIIESSSHMIWTVDNNYCLTSFNQNYDSMVKEFYNTPAKVGQVINKGKMISTKEYNTFWNKKYEVAFNGAAQHFETSMPDKKGNISWREIYLNPIFGADGKVKEVSGIGHDITEKKLAEERIKQSLHEKEVLLKEVHHRVKNNLQVISSILNLQSSYVKDKNTLAMLKESQNRIKSMAFIHESLYQTKDFSNINFSEYVTNLSRNLVHSYEMPEGNIGLTLDIDNVFLNLDQSIPCGLIINELITNSLKYAFRGRKKGTIEVSVKKKGQDMRISIADNGVGLPLKVDYRNTESLGLQLVVTLTEQLNGKLKLDRKKGTKFTVSFKQQEIKTRI